jgi:hypothetical protein
LGGKRGHVVGDDKKRAIASTMLAQMNSLMPRVLAATAPVFSFDQLANPVFLASAVLVKVSNEHFALTAGHVLDARSASPLYVGSGNTVVLLQGHHMSTVPPVAGQREQDRIDLGIVRLSEETVRGLKEDEFLTLADLAILETATTTGHYVFAGYPSSKHKRSIKNEEAEAALYSFISDPAPLEDYQRAGLDPSTSLLLRFDKQKLWCPSGRVIGPDLFGVSGGGVWFLDDAPAATPRKPLLVAIAVEWWQKQPKRVLATKIHVVVAALWDSFPKLRPHLPEPPHKGERG